jgi:hypothetical protein
MLIVVVGVDGSQRFCSCSRSGITARFARACHIVHYLLLFLPRTHAHIPRPVHSDMHDNGFLLRVWLHPYRGVPGATSDWGIADAASSRNTRKSNNVSPACSGCSGPLQRLLLLIELIKTGIAL